MGEMGGPGRREESVLCKFGAMAGDRGVGTDPLPKLHPTRLPEIPAFRFWPAGLFCQFSVCCWFSLPHGHVNVVRFKERIRGFERLRAWPRCLLFVACSWASFFLSATK